MKVQLTKINAIKLNENNPRFIRDSKFDKLVKSVKEFPEMLEIRPIVVNSDMVVLGGNMRLAACKEAKLKEVPVIIADDLTAEQQKEFIIKDNASFGEWDIDDLANNWELEQLEDWGLDIDFSVLDDEEENDEEQKEEAHRKLSLDFVVPPFTILDSRQGYWNDRKRYWKQLINDNGESRENTLAGNGNIMSNMNNGVSILDPVLAEIAVRWFALPNSKIFDCFAGDSVFGYVASYLNNNFTGIELRKEQAELNNQRVEAFDSFYINDDGQNVAKHIEPNSQDMLFSCPPYFDLEVYSDLENDASNQKEYSDFLKILDNAFKDAIQCLKDDRFAVIVVGDVRDAKTGYYYRFVDDIKNIFTTHGMGLYNEMVFVEPLGTLPQRVRKWMKHRKIGKCHQNVLVFYKGNTKNIAKNFPELNIEIDESENV